MKRLITIALFSTMINIFGFGQNRIGGIRFPKDEFMVASTSIDGLPAVVVVNSAMNKFKARDVFGWYLSLIIDYNELSENGMPTPEESQFVMDYFETLDAGIRGDVNRPNAVFIARETHNGKLHAIWQVNNPELANQYLQGIINGESYPREMEFIMEYDATWKESDIYLELARRK